MFFYAKTDKLDSLLGACLSEGPTSLEVIDQPDETPTHPSPSQGVIDLPSKTPIHPLSGSEGPTP